MLALVLTFFFLKDGPRFLPWLAAQTGPRAAPHVAELSQQSWRTLSEFIRQQALVGLIDAAGIGAGLLVLGVPLVLPLAVITFFAAFIPIIGAFVAGGFAVLIALVSNGFGTALWCWPWSSSCSRSRATCCSRSCRAGGSSCTPVWSSSP